MSFFFFFRFCVTSPDFHHPLIDRSIDEGILASTCLFCHKVDAALRSYNAVSPSDVVWFVFGFAPQHLAHITKRTEQQPEHAYSSAQGEVLIPCIAVD